MFTFSFFSLRFFLETGWCHYSALIVTPSDKDAYTIIIG